MTVRGRLAPLAVAAAALLACREQGRGERGEQDARREQSMAQQEPRGPTETRGGQAPAQEPLGAETAQGGAGPSSAQREKSDLRAQPGEARPAPETTVSGHVVRVTGNELVLRRGDGQPEVTLVIGPATPVVREGGGERASAEALREGTEVRAAYTIPQGGKPTATRIEVSGAR